MRGILFIGGLGPSPEQFKLILRSTDVICAADSGLDTCLAAAIEPHGVVGDMDSLSDVSLLKALAPATVEISAVDKDETDTELGIAWLRRKGADEIILIGGGEGRLDHTLALRALFGGERMPSLWYTAREQICPIDAECVITGEAGARVSFFPVGSGPWSVRSQGLVWELDDLDWSHDSVSLSNRLRVGAKRVGEAKIQVASGRLLMIRPLDDALLEILRREQ